MLPFESIRWDAAAVLSAALGLALLPGAWRDRVQAATLDALTPAQQAIAAGQAGSRELAASLLGDWPGQKAELTRQVEELRAERDALAAQLAVHWPDAEAASEASPARPPLLESQLVVARVLGRQAQACLAPADLLEIGRSAGIAADALVTDAPVLLDAGQDAGLAAGHLAFTGRRVLGRVGVAGQRTSTLQRLTDLGYRDLVALAHVESDSLRITATGVLEGAGDGLCRIRRVEVTHPIDVGDYVLTAETEGLLPQPLFYGQIVRAERLPDSPHWELWMAPAAGPRPTQAAVLRTTTIPR